MIKGTARGTIRLTVVNTTNNKGRYYLKLSEGGVQYEDGAWVSQKKVAVVRKGANHPT
jgi:hypothetical protein